MSMERGQEIRLVLADDHKLFREGLKRIINLEEDMIVVGESGDGRAAIETCRELQPDVILMDINMPELNGIEATQMVEQACEKTKVIMLSIHDDESYVFESLRKGASGYLLKDMEAESLIEAIRIVAKGQAYVHPKVTGSLIDELKRLSAQEHEFTAATKPVEFNQENDVQLAYWRSSLTNREEDVLKLMAKGCNNRVIGEKLFISEKTVKNHVSSILQKMDVQDRTQAVITAIKNGWVELD
jgi:two-component system response regulator DegU